MRAPSILDAALGYTESSPQWPIIPIRPGDKRPLIATGTDHAEHASTDPHVIRAWCASWPDMLIGAPTGAISGTVVIDVDAKHDGEALLAELEASDVLGPLPRVRVVRTRSGGLHVYCAHPGEGVRVRSGATRGQLTKLLGGRPGIDVRADGALVVLPPSPGYTWLVDEDGAKLPPLPALWLAAINGAGDPPTPRTVTTQPLPEDAERRAKRARAYVKKLPGSVAGSGGDDALWDAIAHVMIGFDLDRTTTHALIVEDFNPRCDPPWSAPRLEYKLTQVAKHCTRTRGYLLGGAR